MRRDMRWRFVMMVMLLPLWLMAQEQVDLQMLGRIRQEGFNNSQVMDHAWFLTDVYGPRLTGSPNLKAASEWARDRFKAWGLDNARLESWGTFGRGWAVEKFSLEMLEPQYQVLLAWPEAWTPGTNSSVIGEPVYVTLDPEADPAEYQGKLQGAIVLLGAPEEAKLNLEADAKRLSDKELADLAKAPDPEERPAWQARREERQRLRAQRQKMEEFLHNEGAAVLLRPSREHDDGTFDVTSGGSPSRNAKPELPSVAVALEHYSRMVRLIEKNIPVRVAINVQNKFYTQDSLGYNVIAEIPGVDKKLKAEVVMLGAHLDSWHGGTGATDNAAGTAVVMEAVRILQALNAQPRRTIRAALWTGEEQGLLGSRGYVKEHFGDRASMQLKPEHERFSVYFNMDNGSGKFRGIYLQENEATRPVFTAWFAPFQDLDANVVSIRNTSGTDHLAFNEIGLPGFQFIQDPLEYRSRTHHSNMDVYDRLARGDLMQAAVIMAAFVYNAAMREEKFPRKELPKPQPAPTTMR